MHIFELINRYLNNGNVEKWCGKRASDSALGSELIGSGEYK